MNDKKFLFNFSRMNLADKIATYNQYEKYMTLSMKHVLQRMIGLETLYRRNEQ